MKRLLAAAALAWLATSPVAGAPPSPPPATTPPAINLHPGAAPPSKELIDTLAERDRTLFDAVFGCKLDVLAGLLTEDFEFFHDKWGQTASSRKQFLDVIGQGCERQKTGSDFKARRELVEGSVTVHVFNNYGAMQMGTHRFYALQPGRPDRLTESGKFIDLWKQEDGTWRLARVISYDHRLAE
jgi:uncharacterized protein DUF4440